MTRMEAEVRMSSALLPETRRRENDTLGHGQAVAWIVMCDDGGGLIL